MIELLHAGDRPTRSRSARPLFLAAAAASPPSLLVLAQEARELGREGVAGGDVELVAERVARGSRARRTYASVSSSGATASLTCCS